MAATARKTNPALWETIKAEVQAGDKGGEKGEWSARKAQLAVARYKKAGGGYQGRKDPHNHLVEWEKEDWGTASGRPSGETHERYLPQKARAALSDDEYRRTSAKKKADTARGHQFSAQPGDIAGKTASFRERGDATPTKADLMAQARERDLPGRSTMTKAELQRALAR